MKRTADSLASHSIRALEPTNPGQISSEALRALGVGDPVWLGSNENAFGPSPRALEAMASALQSVNRYPDGGTQALRARLARKLDLSAEHFIFGNGTNELLDLLARAFLSPGDEALYAHPAFVAYDAVVAAVGGAKVRVPLLDFTHDLLSMADAITARTKLIFVANPNNPTGTCVRPEEIERFMSRVPDTAIVVFDEAYGEYLPASLASNTLRFVRAELPVVVLRTFSKVYGLAGLRIGYAVAPPEIISVLNRLRQPFNVNVLAQHAALAALDDDAHLDRCLRLNDEGRSFLAQRLREMGFEVVPSVTNFILVNVKQSGPLLAKALLRHGVVVQPLARAGLPESLRITVGTCDENRRLLAALQAELATTAEKAAG